MMDVVTPDLSQARRKVGTALFERIAGPEGQANRARIHETAGPRWFGPDRPIRLVHSDSSMFVGGLRALLLQSLHPLAMAAVAGHSGYRGDPWGRLQRTSTFLAETTFATAADAERAIQRVRTVHEYVRGTAPDGRPYYAGDPHLLRWVHIAEIDSFLRCYERYGSVTLTAEQADGYVTDTAHVARALGVPDPPCSRSELAEQIDSYRPELRGTPEARDAAKFMLLRPPLPVPARLPYAALAASAVASLPAWSRPLLRLPHLPVTEATAIRLAGHGIVGGIRWAMSASTRVR